jgi:hypothetical protein
MTGLTQTFDREFPVFALPIPMCETDCAAVFPAWVPMKPVDLCHRAVLDSYLTIVQISQYSTK